ncbi:hypothetical protein I7I53_02360 [Histoplasma capsulatum var. duboisii H88]|uniref:Uncharacterized protein n=1 Tax=Ajellomyces capsulatus (strain H88) TaxID=544711 RepID=A0A8A1LL66_AJEC8|nr:hypothetical protein I7I53_02360 [Histoplasma capsulatum var. duboisii H88]
MPLFFFFSFLFSFSYFSFGLLCWIYASVSHLISSHLVSASSSSSQFISPHSVQVSRFPLQFAHIFTHLFASNNLFIYLLIVQCFPIFFLFISVSGLQIRCWLSDDQI